MRWVEAGEVARNLAGRIRPVTRSPPQFGQVPFNTLSAQAAQNVHSNEHIRACVLSAGKSRSQHSQLGRNSSMEAIPRFEPAPERKVFLLLFLQKKKILSYRVGRAGVTL
jgi:hypothetical protein